VPVLGPEEIALGVVEINSVNSWATWTFGTSSACSGFPGTFVFTSFHASSSGSVVNAAGRAEASVHGPES